MAGVGGVEFREVEPEDWAGIAVLLGRAPEDGAPLRGRVQEGYDPWFGRVAEPRPTSASGAGADAGRREVVGAVVAGAPRLAPGVEAQDRPGRILWLGVAGPYRRRGIGGQLLDLALDELRRRQFRRAALAVEGTQVEAVGLFRKAGFETESESIGLVLPPAAVAAVAPARPPATVDSLRPLTLDEVPLLGGLLVQLGIERAEAPHDDLPALTPAELEGWLQRPGTVAFAAWEEGDPQTPLGLVWASRRQGDAVLRFIAVQEEARRQGIGRALLGALARALAGRPAAGAPDAAPAYLPLRAQLNEAGPEQAFFRRAGFEAERVTLNMAREL